MADRVAERRRAYAAEITRRAGVADPRIEAAFAAVPREDFAGPPPWRIGSGGLFGQASSDDPSRLYEDVLVAIDPRAASTTASRRCMRSRSTRSLSRRATRRCRSARAPAITPRSSPSSSVPTGRVTAYEIEPDIAALAAANLARYAQVEVRARSGVEDLPPADAIYVNAAASHPLRAWLDALKPAEGSSFRFRRPVRPGQCSGSRGPNAASRGRRACSRAWCSSLARARRTPRWARKLDEAFRRGGSEGVRSLRFGGEPRRTDWLRGDGWALSTERAG